MAYHKTSRRADDEERTLVAHAALFVKPVVTAAVHKEVRNTQAEDRHYEVHEHPAGTETAALCLTSRARFRRERAIGTEVVLTPLSYSVDQTRRAKRVEKNEPRRSNTRAIMRVWTMRLLGVSLLQERRRPMSSWHSCGENGGVAVCSEGKRQSAKDVSEATFLLVA